MDQGGETLTDGGIAIPCRFQLSVNVTQALPRYGTDLLLVASW